MTDIKWFLKMANTHCDIGLTLPQWKDILQDSALLKCKNVEY